MYKTEEQHKYTYEVCIYRCREHELNNEYA